MTGTAQQPPVWLIKRKYCPAMTYTTQDPYHPYVWLIKRKYRLAMMHTTQVFDKDAQSSAPAVMEGFSVMGRVPYGDEPTTMKEHGDNRSHNTIAAKR